MQLVYQRGSPCPLLGRQDDRVTVSIQAGIEVGHWWLADFIRLSSPPLACPCASSVALQGCLLIDSLAGLCLLTYKRWKLSGTHARPSSRTLSAKSRESVRNSIPTFHPSSHATCTASAMSCGGKWPYVSASSSFRSTLLALPSCPTPPHPPKSSVRFRLFLPADSSA